MQRRRFLGLLGAAAGARLLRGEAGRDAGPTVQTVRGPVAAAELGIVLPHEHVLVDFVGAAEVSSDRYRADEVLAVARPHVVRARELGVGAIFECTPAYMARDPRLLRRLSEATGVHLVTNTGLYGARRNKFLPPYAHQETARQLAARWIAEARDGIDGTGIRPGFIKCGVDPEPVLSPLHRKLVEAAASSHAETGLTVAVHTGRGPGLEQIDLLAAHGVAAKAYVWVHAQHALDEELFTAAAREAWISLDGLNPSSLARHRHLCVELRRRSLLGRVLLSHDAGWYDPAKPGGGEFRGYTLLFAKFLPMLRDAGFEESELRQLTVTNPAEALAVRRRPL